MGGHSKNTNKVVVFLCFLLTLVPKIFEGIILRLVFILFYYICDCKLLEKLYGSRLALIFKKMIEVKLDFSFKIDIGKKSLKILKNQEIKELDQINLINVKDLHFNIHYQFKFRL